MSSPIYLTVESFTDPFWAQDAASGLEIILQMGVQVKDSSNILSNSYSINSTHAPSSILSYINNKNDGDCDSDPTSLSYMPGKTISEYVPLSTSIFEYGLSSTEKNLILGGLLYATSSFNEGEEEDYVSSFWTGFYQDIGKKFYHSDANLYSLPNYHSKENVFMEEPFSRIEDTTELVNRLFSQQGYLNEENNGQLEEIEQEIWRKAIELEDESMSDLQKLDELQKIIDEEVGEISDEEIFNQEMFVKELRGNEEIIFGELEGFTTYVKECYGTPMVMELYAAPAIGIPELGPAPL